MICFPAAKINLGLNIIDKRADSYHNIESVLYPVPLHDILEFQTAKIFNIKTFGINLDINQEENILFKTWSLLNEKYSVPPLEIILLKNIPLGSGLGGGSSDAAFLIKSANKHFKLGLTIAEMKLAAAQTGSDCPFFIENKTACVSGRGEILKDVKFSLQEKYLIIAYPNNIISSSDAYDKIQPHKPIKPVSEIILQSIETWKNELKNDFEELIFTKYPQIKMLKESLYKSGAVYASMSGSGSSVYGVFNRQPVLTPAIIKQIVWAGFIDQGCHLPSSIRP